MVKTFRNIYNGQTVTGEVIKETNDYIELEHTVVLGAYVMPAKLKKDEWVELCERV